jgi:hypothetical protein
MVLAFLGMVGYGYFASRPVSSGPAAAPTALEKLQVEKAPALPRPGTAIAAAVAGDGGGSSSGARGELLRPLRGGDHRQAGGGGGQTEGPPDPWAGVYEARALLDEEAALGRRLR